MINKDRLRIHIAGLRIHGAGLRIHKCWIINRHGVFISKFISIKHCDVRPRYACLEFANKGRSSTQLLSSISIHEDLKDHREFHSRVVVEVHHNQDDR